jgi:hypothetical protein
MKTAASTSPTAMTGDFFHGADGGFFGVEAAFDVLFDGFHDDDGVIHDDSDGQYESEEGEVIQAEAEQGECGEGSDDGHGDGDEGDDGWSPALEKQEHDECDEDDGVAERFEDFADGFAYEGCGVVAGFRDDACGEIF